MNERLMEIDARLVEIRGAVELPDADLDVLEAEANKLKEERAEFVKKAEQRKRLLEGIAAGEIKTELVEKPDERKHKMDNKILTPDSAEYREAWLKNLQKTIAEQRSGEGWASATALGAIPTVTSGLFLEKMVQVAPLLNEISLYHVPGNFSISVEGTRAAAAIHTENALITGSDDTTTVITLGGYEIAKLVSVSKTVQKMGINEFEQFLVQTLGGDVARLVETYLVSGNGSTQPKGIEEAYTTWTNDTNGVQWASSNTPTAAEIMELIGYLEGSYAPNAKFLMNHKTFWTKIMTLRDDSKYPVVNVDGDVKRLMGFPVIFSSKVPDYTMYFGDFKKAVVANMSEDINVALSEHSGFRSNAIDYRASCIFDSKIALPEAIVKGATSIA